VVVVVTMEIVGSGASPVPGGLPPAVRGCTGLPYSCPLETATTTEEDDMSDQSGDSWGEPQNPQNPYGQDPQQGQPGQPGQAWQQGQGLDPSHWAQQPPAEQSPKKKTGLIIGGVIAVVVVICAVVAAYFLIGGDDDGDEDRMHDIAESFTEVETVDDYLDWGSDHLVDAVYQQEKEQIASFSDDGKAEVEDYFARGVDVGRTEEPAEAEVDNLADEDIDGMNEALERTDIDEDTLRSSRLVYITDENGDDVMSLLFMKLDDKVQVAGVTQEGTTRE
jgi:hypothetical protein